MIKEVNVLGMHYKIEEVECVSKDCLEKGEIRFLENRILIDKTMPEELKEQTLMHEIIHAICAGLGLEELNQDEQTVQSLATALHCLFKSQVIFSS